MFVSPTPGLLDESSILSKILTEPIDTKVLVELLSRQEQREMPVDHKFAPGIYIREISMPADTLVIGHTHKTKHFNIVLSGRALILVDGEWQKINAPMTFVSGAGVQKTLYILEDMLWQTVHVNPTDSQDVPALEEALVELDAETLLRKGNMDLDSLRLSVNKQLHHQSSCPLPLSELQEQLPPQA